MLTDQQKVDIRRFCGFPVYGLGVGTTPPSFGYRYYTWYLILEYRMNNLSSDEETTLQNVYLTNLYTLENAIPASVTNLDTERAAVWYHNQNEVRDKYNLFNLWCKRLIEFMGLDSPSKMINGVSVVV